MTEDAPLTTVQVRGGKMPAPMFRHLYPIAREQGRDVFDLLVELARRQLLDPTPPTPAPAKVEPEAPARRMRRWTPDELEALGHMHATGLSDHAIGRHLDRGAGTIATKRRSLGLPANYASFRDGYNS